MHPIFITVYRNETNNLCCRVFRQKENNQFSAEIKFLSWFFAMIVFLNDCNTGVRFNFLLLFVFLCLYCHWTLFFVIVIFDAGVRLSFLLSSICILVSFNLCFCLVLHSSISTFYCHCTMYISRFAVFGIQEWFNFLLSLYFEDQSLIIALPEFEWWKYSSKGGAYSHPWRVGKTHL